MYRVVVADDDGKACKKAVEFLQNNGYQVVGEAADGLEAVMVCRRERPDFVIMDLSMPVMTGLEAIRVIHREKLAGFIIVLTSCRNKALLHQAAQEDIMGYLVKPVEESALLGVGGGSSLSGRSYYEGRKGNVRKTKKSAGGQKITLKRRRGF